MKKLILSLVVIMTNLVSLPLFSQVDNEPVALGLPGDNLNLYAVLEVFQKSPTLEAFERAINDKESKINNLDLNNDNVTDYIEVVSYKEGNSNSIVLRDAINSKEYQDLAVIEVHKNNAGKVLVQIIGDEELYGKNYIVEPSDYKAISETPNPGYSGEKTVIINNNYSTINGNGVYYVNDWPIVAYLFSPAFSVYISPWHWGYYPSYWYPWTPIYYYNYWGYHSHYYNHHLYRRARYVRYPVHYSHYVRTRNSSPFVSENRRNGRYNSTYEGKVYRKPEAPAVRPPRPVNRAITPTTRPTRPVTPEGRPVTPTTRPVTPTTRPLTPEVRPVTPTTRPVPPTTRPVSPTTRPVPPSSRPVTPEARPVTPTTRPARPIIPSTRPVTPTTRPATPSVRPIPPEGRPARPIDPSSRRR